MNYGLRFLPSKDLHNETVLPDGSNPEFSFTVRSAGAFDDRTLVDTPITAHITVISANDPPRLDPDTDYHLTGMYIFDAANPVTNQGSSVFEIVRKGFFDVDEPEKATRSNMGMVIVSADDSRGDWHWSSSAGGEWHDFPKDLSPTRPLLVRAVCGGQVAILSKNRDWYSTGRCGVDSESLVPCVGWLIRSRHWKSWTVVRKQWISFEHDPVSGCWAQWCISYLPTESIGTTTLDQQLMAASFV